MASHASDARKWPVDSGRVRYRPWLDRGDSATLPCGVAEPHGGDHFVMPQHDLCVAADQIVMVKSWPAAKGSSATLEYIPV